MPTAARGFGQPIHRPRRAGRAMPALVSTCGECSGLSVHHVRIHFSCVSSARAGVELSWSSTSGMSCCRVQWCPVQLAAGARYCGGPWDACHCFTHARAARVLPRCARIKGVRVAAAVGMSGPTPIICWCAATRRGALAWREVLGATQAQIDIDWREEVCSDFFNSMAVVWNTVQTRFAHQLA